MADSDLLERYNYDSFVPEKFHPWLNFDSSPPVGRVVPDFPLWDLDEQATTLKSILSHNDFTIVEFGSFT